MENLRLTEIAAALGAEAPLEADITEISTDTRNLPEGCLFLALRGARFDGHSFAKRAVEEGAVAVVVEYEIEGCPCIVVPDTRRALLQIAAYYRKKFTPILAGVTGSVGKTTTKEMIAVVLSAAYETLKTQGNLNNEIGLPKTLMELNASHEAAVIEMGMSDFGEIHRLSCTTQPTIGVITNIGFSHIENLKSQAGILQAKLEILDGMAEHAPLIVCGDDPRLAPLKAQLSRPVYTYGIENEDADVRAVNIQAEDNSTSFEIAEHGEIICKVTLPCVGMHNVLNALAAYCVGILADITPEQIAAALATYKTVGFRQNIEQHGSYTVIADCYNASPDSMRAALQVLKEMKSSGRKAAVLGDMLELGDLSRKLHEIVGDMTLVSGADQIFCYGTEAQHIAKTASAGGASVFHTEDKIELCSAIRAYLRPGDLLLFKASWGMHLEDCIKEIFKEEDEQNAVLD
ncbi:MAG: UDP-N-acetylmuramoyl-tripeptide--D-alanyl-D-alanine ligase [Ruminococcus sp.]|nr:UDP-N-acetylmuramoyl-tripeptide--D-alanyl-D-alanine ligase [Ruminococcus sp.]